AFSGNVDLTVPGALYFNGNITLLPAGITDPAYVPASLNADGIPTIGGTTVALNAAYIRLLGGFSNGAVLPKLADGTLNVNAGSDLDLAGFVSASNAASVNLASGGDIRFLNPNDPAVSPYLAEIAGAYNPTNISGFDPQDRMNSPGAMPFPGGVIVADDLTLTAREAYPETDTDFVLLSLGLAPQTASGVHGAITIRSNGRAPVAPLSANGAILVDAKTILQDGVLLAPLGTIQIGYSADETLPNLFFTGTVNDPFNPTSQPVFEYLPSNITVAT